MLILHYSPVLETIASDEKGRGTRDHEDRDLTPTTMQDEGHHDALLGHQHVVVPETESPVAF